MLERLFEIQRTLVRAIRTDFKRYLYPRINWDARAIALIGARGTGKTTLLLQYYLEKFNNPEQCLYILGDDLVVAAKGIRRIAEEFHKLGGQLLLIDEIHKYPNWSQELKNIYDTLPRLKLIISGSATLRITQTKYDLSRRVVTYSLRGLSFREFVRFQTGLRIKALNLKDMISNHPQVAESIVQSVESQKAKILKLFASYLSYGYYPIYLEEVEDYRSKLENTLDKVLYEDIPAIFKIKPSSIPVLRKFIHLVGSSSPYSVDIQKTARNIGVARDTVYLYLDYLTRAEVFMGIKAARSGARSVRKPEKLYLQNPNLYTLISRGEDIATGTIRECFAANQLLSRHTLTVPKRGDLLVDSKYTLEVGGQTKSSRQVSKEKEGYVFSDGIEVGYQRKIPLYLLGFLY